MGGGGIKFKSRAQRSEMRVKKHIRSKVKKRFHLKRVHSILVNQVIKES